jgi:hypothetical protein
VIELSRCPLCGCELIEEVETVSLRGTASGSSVAGGSLDAYYGSVDFYVASGSEIIIRYYKCSNPDCPYLRRKIEKQ